jgi:hypothetical protein
VRMSDVKRIQLSEGLHCYRQHAYAMSIKNTQARASNPSKTRNNPQLPDIAAAVARRGGRRSGSEMFKQVVFKACAGV